jgi:hypothetical protein
MPKSFNEFVNAKLGTQKPWKAKKGEILQLWQSMKPNMPLSMQPVPENHKGTRFNHDGIRVTGSPQFINTVMSRLKDLMQFEREGVRLDVEYRQVEAKSEDPKPGYVFYAHLVQEQPEPPEIEIPGT